MAVRKKAVWAQRTEFTDKVSGDVKFMWKVSVIDDNDGIGFVYSPKEVRTGDTLDIGLITNRDGRLAVKIIDIIPEKASDSIPTPTEAPPAPKNGVNHKS